MATQYELWLSSPFGTRQAVIPHEAISELSYTMTVNAVGTLTVVVDRDALPDAYIVQDAKLEIARKPEGGTMAVEGGAGWLLQTNTQGLSNRERYRKLKFETANSLLKRRHVYYYATTAGAAKTDYADDLMKVIVLENFGADSDSGPFATNINGANLRNWSSTFAVEAYTSQGPSITKEFAWRNVLAVLQEIARDAATLGTPTYFDVVWNGAKVEFRTYVNVRGVDRSAGSQRLVVSAERGSLGETIELTEDWTDTLTLILAGGQGQGWGRKLGEAYDLGRMLATPWSYREGWLDATALSVSAALSSEARSRLQEKRPKKILTGGLVSVPGAVYGRDWGFGDQLIAEFEGESFTARVDQVTVALADGKETVTAAIRGET